MKPSRFLRPDGAADYVRWTRLGATALAAALLAVFFFARGALVGPAASAEQPKPAAGELSEDEAGPGQAKASGAPGETAAPGPKTRTMLDTIKDGGVIGGIIIFLSVVAVGFIFEHALSLRKPVIMPQHVLDDLEQMIARGQVDKAIEYCHLPETHSPATSIVLAGLERYKGSQFGFAEYKSACEEEGEEQTARLYRKTEVLGVIGAVAPMLGLLGTVAGMIWAFNTIAEKKGMARPEDLAGAIGQALVTTLEGLIVAIPTVIAFSYFRNKIDSIVSEAGKRIERIMMPLGRQKTK